MEKVKEGFYAGSAVGMGSNASYSTGPVSYSTWQNRVFRAKHRSLTDLGQKGNIPSQKIPVDDHLDGLSKGDYVIGKDFKDLEQEGPITRIEKNSDGKNIKIYILSREKVEVELKPSTVEITKNGKKGSREGIPGIRSLYAPGEYAPDTNPYQQFKELNEDQGLMNIKSYGDFKW